MQTVSKSIYVLHLLLKGSEFVEFFTDWEWPNEENMRHMIKKLIGNKYWMFYLK
jgi:hypothetical protein